MAKKKKHEGHVNHERWMVSYADFMTLLFAVFVVLYGFAMANQNEAVALAEGLKNSFSKMGLINQPIQSQNLIEISRMYSAEIEYSDCNIEEIIEKISVR